MRLKAHIRDSLHGSVPSLDITPTIVIEAVADWIEEELQGTEGAQFDYYVIDQLVSRLRQEAK